MPSIKDKLRTEERQNKSTRFPHFSRFIPAPLHPPWRVSEGQARNWQAIYFSLRFLVFVVILTFFLVNFVGAGLAPALGRPQGAPPRERLLINPTNPENYRLLAAEFLKNHDLQNATYFNDLGLSLFPTSLTLLKQKDEIYYAANEPRFLAQEIPLWKKVVNYYPDYRDGYARLMWLNLKLGRTADAKKYLEMIKMLDPNWIELDKINI